MTLAQILTEKTQEVKEANTRLATLERRIVDNWRHYDNMGRRYGYRCRECLRVLPIIRADEAQQPIMIAKLKTAQDSLKQLQSRLQALKNALSSPPPPTKTQSTQKVLKSIESLQDFLKTSLEKFALGFAAGASGAKALSGIFKHKQAQNYALKSIKNLQKEYKALQEHILPLFAKIMSDIPPQVFIKPSKESKKLSNDIFNKELAQVIQNAINKDGIKELPQANFKNISEFRGNFDKVKNNIGYLDTPLGQIRVNTQYALHHFTNNTYYKDRTNIKGGFFETFRNPLFVIEDDTKGKGSIYFYKPFYDKEKNMLNLFGIGVNQKGIINFKTYYLDEKKSRLKQLLKNEGVKIRYVAKE